MPIKFRLITILLLISGFSLQAAVGQAAEDVAGSVDLDLLGRYPNSWIVDYSQHSVPEYRLATGSMKKINGVIAPEFEQYIAGRLTRITYRLPSGRSSADALGHFEAQFERLPLQSLYRCDGRACGDSNQWANIQFRIAKLYGIDREQYYRAFEWPQPDTGSAYLAFYTVKRGNKRVYVQFDLIEPETAAMAVSSAADVVAGSLVAALQAGERTVHTAEQLSTADINGLIGLLRDQPNSVLMLVGHIDQPRVSDKNRADSLQLANALKQQLLARGVAGAQVDTFGVGSVAPAYDIKTPLRRVEWLLRSR